MALGLAAVSALIGCAWPTPLEPVDVEEPKEIVALVRSREDSIRRMRAVFDVRSRAEGKLHRSRGVLIVDKPDRFRLRLFLPFGFTVFDYLSMGDEVYVRLPLLDHRPNLRDELAAFSRENLGVAFLRGEHVFPGVCTAADSETRDVVVTCQSEQSGVVLRQLLVDGRLGVIREEIAYEDGEARLILSYDDFRPAGDFVLPYRITMVYPGRNREVEIAIDRYAINPDLPEELFKPVE